MILIECSQVVFFFVYLAARWLWPGRCPADRMSPSQSAGRCSLPPAWQTAARSVSEHPTKHKKMSVSAMMLLSREKINDALTKWLTLQISHLHLHHLVFALGAEGPLVGQVVMVVGALVAVQGHGVTWQLDDLDWKKEDQLLVTS